MLDLIPDEGWDEELTSTPSKGYKALKSKFVDDGLVAHYKGNTYIYLAAMNRWSVMISAEAQRQLCDITGGENASVSYLAASLPYIGYMEKHALRTSAIPVSVCIGTKRLGVSKQERGIELTECTSIASIKESLDDRISGFCVMPCSFNQIPRSWSPGGTERMLKFIRVLFNDQIELLTIQWTLGLIAVDPSSVSKFLLLYGPGGTGKSTLIGLIEDVFNGCCGTISSGVLTSKNSNITAETARTIASNRVITAGDINLETNNMNLHTVKEITGHDSVSVPPIKVRTRCSLVAASNNLPHPRVQPTWCSAAISRRVLVVPMNIKTSFIPNVERPDSVEDCIDFLLSSVALYLDNVGSPPISMRSLMYTILGSGYAEIQEKIEFGEDFSTQDIFDANTQIEIHFGLELHSLGELALLVCPDCVVEEGSIFFVKNIRLLEPLSNN